MMKRTLTVLLVFVFTMSVCLLATAQDKQKQKEMKLKAKHMVIHPETGDIKVVTEDYQYYTIYYDKKTKVEAIINATTSDFANEMTQSALPSGTVSYVIKDGKPVATKISFKSGAEWGVKKKKK